MAKRTQTLVGRRFGRWEVRSEALPDPTNRQQFICFCDCGNIRVVRRGNLLKGISQSCGCLNRQHIHEQRFQHGRNTKDSTYRAWLAMRWRCRKEPWEKYHRYAGRGIRVCKRWNDFRNFLSDMGERPQGLSLDRIDNDGNYEPGNCRWATHEQQVNNHSHDTHNPCKGVSWDKSRNRWLAFTSVDGKFKNLGRFSDQEAAVHAVASF